MYVFHRLKNLSLNVLYERDGPKNIKISLSIYCMSVLFSIKQNFALPTPWSSIMRRKVSAVYLNTGSYATPSPPPSPAWFSQLMAHLVVQEFCSTRSRSGNPPRLRRSGPRCCWVDSLEAVTGYRKIMDQKKPHVLPFYWIPKDSLWQWF